MRAPSGISIFGVGHRLGRLVEDNETLCLGLEITPEWILEKTGIRQRFLAGPDESASDLALSAARAALKMAKCSGQDIDLIVCCTFSGDYTFPALAAKIHKELSAKGGQIFDLQANCAGFVSGLTVASDRMRLDPEIRHALVVGVELNSRYISRIDADSAIYHSDGAGAAVLGRPSVDFAATAVGEANHAFEEFGAHQAKHRLCAQLPIFFTRRRHGDVSVFGFECRSETRHEVMREQRRVAGHSQ